MFAAVVAVLATAGCVEAPPDATSTLDATWSPTEASGSPPPPEGTDLSVVILWGRVNETGEYPPPPTGPRAGCGAPAPSHVLIDEERREILVPRPDNRTVAPGDWLVFMNSVYRFAPDDPGDRSCVDSRHRLQTFSPDPVEILPGNLTVRTAGNDVEFRLGNGTWMSQLHVEINETRSVNGYQRHYEGFWEALDRGTYRVREGRSDSEMDTGVVWDGHQDR